MAGEQTKDGHLSQLNCDRMEANQVPKQTWENPLLLSG